MNDKHTSLLTSLKDIIITLSNTTKKSAAAEVSIPSPPPLSAKYEADILNHLGLDLCQYPRPLRNNVTKVTALK